MKHTTASLKVKDHHSCVLYDSGSGKIVSIFHSITYEGAGPAPDQKEMETRARAASKKIIHAATGHAMDEKNVKALFTHPDVFKANRPIKVDLKDLKVVHAE